MRRFFLAALFFVPAAMGQEQNKLWVHEEFNHHDDRIYFIEDLETHTRCYAITNSRINPAGYAISCIGAK